MKAATFLLTTALSSSLVGSALGSTFGSVEPIANPAVVDTRPLRDQPLEVREQFARRLLQCGIVDRVIQVLSASHAITTINGLNTRFEVGAAALPGTPTPPTSTR